MFKVWKSASILVTLALVLSLGLVMSPMAGTAGAATIRVPQDYETIQDAIYAARSGDTIIVAPGIYNETLDIYSAKYNRDGLTIKSSGVAEVTIINGGGIIPKAGMAALNGGPVVDISDVNGVTFQGFTVRGGTGFSLDGLWLPGYGIGMVNASDCLIANNIVTNNEAGIFVLGGTFPMMPEAGLEEGLGQIGGLELVSNGNIIRNNEVYYNGDDMMGMGFGMLLINCDENIIKGNEIHYNEAGGICVIGGNLSMSVGLEGGEMAAMWTLMGAARDNQITDNEIYNHAAFLMLPPPGVLLLNTLHNTVSGNEIYTNFFGVFIAGVEGEIDWGMFQGNSKENVVSGNGIYDSYYGVYLEGWGGEVGVAGEFFGEPVVALLDGAGCVTTTDITDNTIAYNGHGVYVNDANGTRILRNDILNNTMSEDSGIHIGWYSCGTEVHFNNIEGNSPPGSWSYGVYNSGINPLLDATFNWWGDESGPYDPDDNGDCDVPPCTDDPETEKNPDGEGDNVSSNVDYCPWLLERFRPETSASSTTGEGKVGYNTSDWNSAIIQQLEAKDPSQISCSPKAEMFFPYGLFSFKVLLKNPGGKVTMTITLPEDMPEGARYWKCQNEEWVEVTSLLGDDDGDNILTLTLTDGGLGDADGEANGIIVDPGGPAIPIPPPTEEKAVESASFSASYLRISPQQVSPNHPVEISVNIANTGGESGGRAVTLYVNGRAEQSKTVTISPGSTQNVVFTVTKATAGTYEVLLEGQSGQFTVRGTSTLGGGGLGTGGIIAIILVVIAVIVAVIFITRGAPAGA